MHGHKSPPFISGAIGIAAFCAAWAQSVLGAPRWSGYLAIAVGVVAFVVVVSFFVPWSFVRRRRARWHHQEPSGEPNETVTIGKNLFGITRTESTELEGEAREVHSTTNPDGSGAESMGILHIKYLGPARPQPEKAEADEQAEPEGDDPK